MAEDENTKAEKAAAKAAEKLAQEQTALAPEPQPTAHAEGVRNSDEVEITHPKTGQSYGVSYKAFKDLYEPEGFRITRMADGSLLPGDDRAPVGTPADNPPIMVGEPQPEPRADGEIDPKVLSDTERAALTATEESD